MDFCNHCIGFQSSRKTEGDRRVPVLWIFFVYLVIVFSLIKVDFDQQSMVQYSLPFSLLSFFPAHHRIREQKHSKMNV